MKPLSDGTQGRAQPRAHGRVKLDRHAERRRTPAQEASSVKGSISPLSSSASRRMASARFSSGSAGARGVGRLPRFLPAKCSRSLSGSRRAAASISWRVFMVEKLVGKSAVARRDRNPRSTKPVGPCADCHLTTRSRSSRRQQRQDGFLRCPNLEARGLCRSS